MRNLGNVLITGASSGIGAALARDLAPYAAKLIVVARRQERLEALANEIRQQEKAPEVHVLPCDLRDPDAIDAMLETCRLSVGSIDVLVNNAGFGDNAFFEATDWRKLDDMLQLNVRALTYLTWRVFPSMLQHGFGGVLNISSLFGLLALPTYATYIGTKHYVTGFTQALRMDAAGTGVVVTQVCPGPVDTEFHQVAGKLTHMRKFRRLEIPPEQVAREARLGFLAGRDLVVPGSLNRWTLRFTNVLPRFVSRLIGERLSRKLRHGGV